MSLSPGQKLAHYDILAPIGKGGMGEVYRAKDSKLGRDVAIKVLPDEFSQDWERLARFRREAKVLAALNHPNIAAIYGLEESESTHYLVLELVEGETLAERIARGAVPLEEALAFAIQIAEALEEAHEQGIIHRDLKPANVKLTSDDDVKVLDFGLAKAFAEDVPDADSSMSPTITRDATRVGVILGTAAYMSPEQAKGKKVGRRTDVFAFGALLFEMLTGQKAFPGDDVSEVLASVIKLEPDWSALPRAVPDRLRKLLRRCLEKDRKTRRSDIADVKLELQELLEHPGDAVSPRARKGSWGVPVIGMVAFGLLGALAAWNLKPVLPRPVTRFAMALPEGDSLMYTGRRVVALSPDGTQLAYTTQAGIYVRRLDQMEPAPLPGTEGARSPTFSPDGAWVAFWADEAIKKVAAGGGPPFTLCEDRLPHGMSWAHGESITYGQGARGAYRVSSNGGAPELLVEVANGERAFGPEILPGGTHVLVSLTSNAWDDAIIVAQSLETGERKTVLQGGSDARYVPTGHLVYAKGSALLAVPFDAEKIEVTGDPVPVVEHVGRSSFDTGAAQFSFSDTGTLAFTTSELQQSRQLVWVDRTGRAEVITERPAFYWEPRVSPDGERLVARVVRSGSSDLYILDLTRDTLSRLTTTGLNSKPSWSPDNEWVAFTSTRQDDTGLFRKRSDFSEDAQPLVVRNDISLDLASWSPDGNWLVYDEETLENGRDIWIFPFTGNEQPRAILETHFDEGRGQVSPDGHQIAYESNESGKYEIYVTSFPEPGRRISVSTNGGQHPVWSADGSELFFQTGQTVMAASVQPAPEFEVGRVDRLYERPFTADSRHWDPAPNGQRFVDVSQADTKARQQVNVVLNWFDELERLVPTDR